MAVAEFRPEWTSAPGSTIQNMLERRGLSIDELSDVLGSAPTDVFGLITGNIPITDELAKKLTELVGGTEQFWLNREAQYKADLDRLQSQDGNEDAKQWMSELPLKDLVASGWIRSSKDTRNQFISCLKFFDVANINLWRDKYLKIASTASFRSSPTFESEFGAVASWLRIGELSASQTVCESWSKSRLIKNLGRMRGVSRLSNPHRFLPKLGKLCAECGVALVVIRSPNGCRVSGATRFLSADKAMLLLSFRYLSDDHFWFTFFHELGHLALHDKTDLYLEGVEGDMLLEAEANEFAEEVLIPPVFRDDFESLKPTYKDVMSFAKKLGLAPGIVVGQLQHSQRIDRNKLNKLKKRYVWT